MAQAMAEARGRVMVRPWRVGVLTNTASAEAVRETVANLSGVWGGRYALLALATILQAYTGVSDDEVIEATIMDRRWQLVLDCLDTEQAPFSKGTLVGFRTRLIDADLDRRLIERSIALAERTRGFGSRALRAALDSSPLWGAGRTEDTINLMGHALRRALGVIAAGQGWGQAEGAAVLATQAGVPALAGSSLKAALDMDWDDPATADAALGHLVPRPTVGGLSTGTPRGDPLRAPDQVRDGAGEITAAVSGLQARHTDQTVMVRAFTGPGATTL